jgi:type I restriction enzyme S subunit
VRSSNGEFDHRWLSWFVNAPQFRGQVYVLQAGSTRKRISRKNLGTIPLRVPPLQEQRRLVDEIEKQFTRLDAGVAALRRVQENLKHYRAAVLRAACEGRLVPTEAELARPENRSYESGDDLLKGILVERQERWNGRGVYKQPVRPDVGALPQLPDGWVWARLEQLGVVFGGLTKNPRRAKLPRKVPYLRVANVYADELRLEDIETIGVDESELAKLLVEPGDLLIVEGNGSKSQIGRLAIWDGSIAPCVHQNHLIKVRLVNSLLGKWILHWLLSPAGRSLVEVVASSTSGLYTLSVNKVGDLPIAVPPLTEQKRIVEEIERRLSVVVELTTDVAANLRRATRLRQSVLHRAFLGTQAAQGQIDESPLEVAEPLRSRTTFLQDHEGPTMPNAKERPHAFHEKREAREVLISARQPLTPEELFVQCGRDSNDIDDIDRFFVEVRDLVNDGFAEELRSHGAVTIGLRR